MFLDLYPFFRDKPSSSYTARQLPVEGKVTLTDSSRGVLDSDMGMNAVLDSLGIVRARVTLTVIILKASWHSSPKQDRNNSPSECLFASSQCTVTRPCISRRGAHAKTFDRPYCISQKTHGSFWSGISKPRRFPIDDLSFRVVD